ncbi:MAG: polyprenol monophosphomannose synthase [Deltaproteobacteria bacterium]|nr:polyprenol monophosphomannose synthase [Deltaproteobacteria bacterium]
MRVPNWVNFSNGFDVADARVTGQRTIVTLPTYNEAENIAELVSRLRALGVEVLVADDNSPDGTWRIVEAMTAADSGVHLLRRMERKGRGYAGAEAFVKALAMSPARIVEMDADLSHRPEDLPALLSALESGADLAIGSRFVAGGRDDRPSASRRWLTRLTTGFARFLLGTRVRDCNSGFRAYKAATMSLIEPATLTSAGPSIVHEILLRATRRGCRIVEVPIRFVDRERGQSQLTLGRLLDGFIRIFRFRLLAAAGRLWRNP